MAPLLISGSARTCANARRVAQRGCGEPGV